MACVRSSPEAVGRIPGRGGCRRRSLDDARRFVMTHRVLVLFLPFVLTFPLSAQDGPKAEKEATLVGVVKAKVFLGKEFS